ncbi:pyridoxal-phosphate dependent enzyme [Streptomyces sp. GD-15H]|uniref:pyridoxal-phosphate dependent enzyme n=1 Tax=Streptomyces sp. GD-15H TaxID=3129112 RepID=UPI003247B708
MANAWQQGRDELDDRDVVVRPNGLARAILLGDARACYPYLHKVASATGGCILSVTQSELARARHLLAELEGLTVCYSSAATIAAIGKQAADGAISRDHTVLAVLTGRSRA